MTTTHDITVLLAAIDGGDDSALPPLADALEEAGDPRAAGLRLLVARRMTRLSTWVGQSLPFGLAIGDPTTPLARSGKIIGHYVRYATRSVAFLALAEALCDD